MDDEKPENDQNKVVKLVVDNELDLDDMDEDELKELIVNWYGNSRALLLSTVEDALGLHQALIRLKECANWALGTLDIIDEVIDGDDEEEDNE